MECHFTVSFHTLHGMSFYCVFLQFTTNNLFKKAQASTDVQGLLSLNLTQGPICCLLLFLLAKAFSIYRRRRYEQDLEHHSLIFLYLKVYLF